MTYGKVSKGDYRSRTAAGGWVCRLEWFPARHNALSTCNIVAAVRFPDHLHVVLAGPKVVSKESAIHLPWSVRWRCIIGMDMPTILSFPRLARDRKCKVRKKSIPCLLDGESMAEVAARLSVAVRTLKRWIARYAPGGCGNLRDRQRTGRSPAGDRRAGRVELGSCRRRALRAWPVRMRGGSGSLPRGPSAGPAPGGASRSGSPRARPGVGKNDHLRGRVRPRFALRAGKDLGARW